MSDGSGSHCKMISESQRQFNIFTLRVTANVSVAPFVSTTVDVLYTNDFSHTCSKLSVRRRLQHLSGRGCHAEQWEVRCLRRYGRCVCVVQTLTLLLTQDVRRGLNGTCVDSCFMLSHSEGSQGVGIGSSPTPTRILPSSTGSSTISCTIASPRVDEPQEFCDFCNSSTRTHEFCDPLTRTHEFCECLRRTHDFCEFCESIGRTHEFCEYPARTRDVFFFLEGGIVQSFNLHT